MDRNPSVCFLIIVSGHWLFQGMWLIDLVCIFFYNHYLLWFCVSLQYNTSKRDCWLAFVLEAGNSSFVVTLTMAISSWITNSISSPCAHLSLVLGLRDWATSYQSNMIHLSSYGFNIPVIVLKNASLQLIIFFMDGVFFICSYCINDNNMDMMFNFVFSESLESMSSAIIWADVVGTWCGASVAGWDKYYEEVFTSSIACMMDALSVGIRSDPSGANIDWGVITIS